MTEKMFSNMRIEMFVGLKIIVILAKFNINTKALKLKLYIESSMAIWGEFG